MRVSGTKLHRLRKERGMTLGDLATALNVSKPTVWAWEHDKAQPLPDRVADIARSLGAEPDELFGSSIEMATLAEMQAWARGVMKRRPDFVIGDNYLRRWFVVPRNPWFNVYLHDIRKSDDDRAFHDHPWANASFIIAGSYIEHTPIGRFLRVEGDTIERDASSLHRIEVKPGEGAITLFLTGPKVREWGFACPQGWVHFKDFTSEHDTGQTGRGCGEPDDPTPVTPIGSEREVQP
jgi:transcriptional regulator with XRE-family HTH domain